MSADGWSQKRTVRLITRGRKSGQQRSVTVWFVPAGERSIFVQHAGRRPAQWYANLRSDPEVGLDFGAGPLAGRARPIDDLVAVREVLALIRRKYWMAWAIQLLGRGGKPVAAEIVLAE